MKYLPTSKECTMAVIQINVSISLALLQIYINMQLLIFNAS